MDFRTFLKILNLESWILNLESRISSQIVFNQLIILLKIRYYASIQVARIRDLLPANSAGDKKTILAGKKDPPFVYKLPVPSSLA